MKLLSLFMLNMYLLCLVLVSAHAEVNAQAMASSIAGPNIDMPIDIDSEYLAKCKTWGQNKLQNDPHQLTEAESKALFAYTYMGFTELTKGLNGQRSLTECDVMQIELIDRALKKIPNYEGTVYRGTSAKYLAETADNSVEFKSYTSTSKNKDVAITFVRDAFLEIHVQNGKNITPYAHRDVMSSFDDGEEEILLPRNTKIQIIDLSDVEMRIGDSDNGYNLQKVRSVKARAD